MLICAGLHEIPQSLGLHRDDKGKSRRAALLRASETTGTQRPVTQP